jgi:hypothetical protein
MSSPVTIVVRAQAVKIPASFSTDLGSTPGMSCVVVAVVGLSRNVLAFPYKPVFYQS